MLLNPPRTNTITIYYTEIYRSSVKYYFSHFIKYTVVAGQGGPGVQAPNHDQSDLHVRFSQIQGSGYPTPRRLLRFSARVVVEMHGVFWPLYRQKFLTN